MEMIDIFFSAGRVKRGREDNEPVKAPGRNQARNSYAKTFADELMREDMKLRAVPYPQETCDPRRRQELADGGMVREDERAMANLPRQAVHHEYPRLGYYSSPYIDSLAVNRSED
jgi:hypothetical protein